MKNTKFVIKVTTVEDKRNAIILLNKLTGAFIGSCYRDLNDNVMPPHQLDLRYSYLGVADTRIDGRRTSDDMPVYNYPDDLPIIIDKLLSPPVEYTVEDVGDYSATISEDGIEVGCQTISLKKFDEIAEKVALVRKSLQ
jgi:hypothetical protein